MRVDIDFSNRFFHSSLPQLLFDGFVLTRTAVAIGVIAFA
ncbi:hypothetical protein SDC9_94786 [bioreactor metagenome]|uniref:Uncharacterized protein n=1 Tax=bioreactor metagenome TaxID=1076179 RepID=A0A645AEG3_9ZZZZ